MWIAIVVAIIIHCEMCMPRTSHCVPVRRMQGSMSSTQLLRAYMGRRLGSPDNIHLIVVFKPDSILMSADSPIV